MDWRRRKGYGRMARANMRTMERIIRDCVDDEMMLARSGILLDAVRRTVLVGLADERERFVDELQLVGRTLLRTPRARGSLLGVMRRLWLRFFALMGGANAGDAIAACKDSQGRVEATFAAALDLPWTREVHGVLSAQHRRICEARQLLIGIQ
jgi:hypothetical protein